MNSGIIFNDLLFSAMIIQIKQASNHEKSSCIIDFFIYRRTCTYVHMQIHEFDCQLIVNRYLSV